jgi:ribose transport system substrate-binding protein
VTVWLTVANKQLNFAREMADGFRSGVSGVQGVTPQVEGPDIVDAAAQLQMFEDLTAKSKVGTAVFTLNPEIFAGPLATAVQRGIPVIAVDNPPAPNSNVGLFIGNDNVELGRTLADEVIDALPAGTSSGTIVIGTTSPGAAVLDQRAEGMRAEFKAKLPGVTILGPFDTKQEVEANQAAWRLLVKATPKALAFVGTGDADGYNLAAIKRETGGHWVAGAFDLDPKSLAAVRRGELLLVSPEHYVKGAVAGKLLAEHARNHTALPAGWILTPGLAVTKANVDECGRGDRTPVIAAHQGSVVQGRDRPDHRPSGRLPAADAHRLIIPKRSV